VAIGGWYRSRITALHVALPMYYPEGPIPSGPTGGSPQDGSLELLRRFVEPATASSVAIDTVGIEGATAPIILERARELPADLLIMGTHGRGGFDRWVLGSVAEKVLRKAPCPLLTVSRPAQSIQPRSLFQKILFACDFSASSMKALDYALSLAREADARLTLLHVLEWLPSDDERRRSLAEEALTRLREAVSPSAREWLETDEVVTEGRAYREILRIAQERAVELIVMGVQGRGALDVMFFGSTAHHVVRQAVCPVLTVRSS
jgi:nucleotide-binding universal stress UspA family protein